MIGHLSGRILLYGPQKFKVGFTTSLFRDLSQSVFTLIASKSLERSLTLNCVKKRAKNFQIDSFCFRGASEI